MHIRIAHKERKHQAQIELGYIESFAGGIPLDDFCAALIRALILILRQAQIKLTEILHRQHLHTVFRKYAIHSFCDIRQTVFFHDERMRYGGNPSGVRHTHHKLLRLRQRLKFRNLWLQDIARRIIHQREPWSVSFGKQMQGQFFLNAGNGIAFVGAFGGKGFKCGFINGNFGKLGCAEKPLDTAFVPAGIRVFGAKRFPAA